VFRKCVVVALQRKVEGVIRAQSNLDFTEQTMQDLSGLCTDLTPTSISELKEDRGRLDSELLTDLP
jgi:hypothetical protein